jgi:4-hydroxybenzoyl-CoA thioesterase
MMDQSVTRPAEPAGAGEPEVFTHVIRVGWGDCDPALIAFTGRLPVFAIESIDAWWEHHFGAGWYQMELDRGLGTPFVHMSLDFRVPVTPRHRLECRTWPVALGKTSVSFRVDGVQNGVVCFSGRFVCVFAVPQALKKRPPPEEVRALLERHIAAAPPQLPSS